MNKTLNQTMIKSAAVMFGNTLLRDIGAKNYAEVIKRNALSTDKGICASHDFCDANMVMMEVVAKKLGISEDQVVGATADESSAAFQLWNAAWSVFRG